MAAKSRRRSVRTCLGHGGRLMIPPEMRRDLGLSPGAALLISVTADGSLLVSTPGAGLRRARQLVRRYAEPGDSLTDELLSERREHASRE